jgi:dihydrofolate synthase/folylpolyglutamate synthase
MLGTKDVQGYLAPLTQVADSLTAVTIPDSEATLPADVTAGHARAVGLPAATAETTLAAVTQLAAAHPGARLLICGSLYLAGDVLKENG